MVASREGRWTSQRANPATSRNPETTMNATDSTPATDTWVAQLEQLRARYKHVREPILVALNILLHDQSIALDDAKAKAAEHGVKITAASVGAAKRLLERQDDRPAGITVVERSSDGFAAEIRGRPKAKDAAVHAEALIRGVVCKLQARGDAELERVRDGIRRVIAILQGLVGS